MDPFAGKINLDFRASEPIYLQIVRQIERLVVSGELHQGDHLPTVRQLATELRVNFNTIARAYRLLDEARLISTQRGRGTYIWEEPTKEMIDHLNQNSLEELAQNYINEAAKLGFTPQAAISVLQRFSPANPDEDLSVPKTNLENIM